MKYLELALIIYIGFTSVIGGFVIGDIVGSWVNYLRRRYCYRDSFLCGWRERGMPPADVRNMESPFE